MSLRTNIWVSLIWGFFAIAGAAAFGGARPGAAAIWAFIFWSMSLINIFVLGRIVDLMLGNGAKAASESSPNRSFHTLFWAGAKVACLGSFAAVLIKAGEAPTSGLLLGMATLIAVPLVSGLGWDQKEPGNAS